MFKSKKTKQLVLLRKIICRKITDLEKVKASELAKKLLQVEKSIRLCKSCMLVEVNE
jgi:recombinational DNA repair protein RecR